MTDNRTSRCCRGCYHYGHFVGYKGEICELDELNKGYVACYSCGATGPKVEARRGANSKAKSLWMKAVSMLMEADS